MSAQPNPSTLKLFIWEGDDVLPDAYGGLAGALAVDVDAARELIKAELSFNAPAEKTDFLNRSPNIETRRPTAFFQVGSS